jgi:hypothetical protein
MDIVFILFVSRNGNRDTIEINLFNSLQEIGITPTGIQHRGDKVEVWFPDPGQVKTAQLLSLRFTVGEVATGLSKSNDQHIKINYNGFDPLVNPQTLADYIDTGTIINYYRQSKRIGGEIVFNGIHTFWVRGATKCIRKKLGVTERCFYNQTKLNELMFGETPQEAPPTTHPPAVPPQEAPPINLPQAPAVPAPCQQSPAEAITLPIILPPAPISQSPPAVPKPATPEPAVTPLLPTPPPPIAPPAVSAPPPEVFKAPVEFLNVQPVDPVTALVQDFEPARLAIRCKQAKQPSNPKPINNTQRKRLKKMQSKFAPMLRLRMTSTAEDHKAINNDPYYKSPECRNLFSEYAALWLSLTDSAEHYIDDFPLDIIMRPIVHT